MVQMENQYQFIQLSYHDFSCACVQCVLLCLMVCGEFMVGVCVSYDCQLEEGVSVVDLLLGDQYLSLM
jgi:ribonuclease PH